MAGVEELCRTYGARPHFPAYPHLRLRVRSPSVWANLWSRLRGLELGEDEVDLSLRDVRSNFESIDQRAYAAGRSIQRKRGGRRPTLPPKNRPDFQQIYVPCAGFTTQAQPSRGKHGNDVHGHDLNHKMPSDDCCVATVESFRDVVYLSKGIP